MEEQVKMLERRMEEQASNMQIMMQMLKELKDNTHVGSQGGNQDSGHRGNHEVRPQGMIPKLQLPSFDGTNPRIWIKKCSRYFSLCKMLMSVGLI